MKPAVFAEAMPNVILVRHGEEYPYGEALSFTWAEWREFLAAVKRGEYEPELLLEQTTHRGVM